MTAERRVLIAPSILSADFSRLGEEVRAVETAGADWMHLDVMDGHFVPNLTIGPGIVKAVDRVTNLPLDVHLMIDNPADFIEEFAKAGADYLVVHQEGQPHLHRLVGRIRELGMKAGVALNPSTPIETLSEVKYFCDLVVVMSVNPGFGGQSFIPTSTDKIARARAFLPEDVIIEVDGGVSEVNAGTLVGAGATWLVAGSSVFGGPDIEERFAAVAQAAASGV